MRNKAPRNEDVWERGEIFPHILNLDLLDISSQLHALDALSPVKELEICIGEEAA
jgi:hypothetical protein